MYIFTFNRADTSTWNNACQIMEYVRPIKKVFVLFANIQLIMGLFNKFKLATVKLPCLNVSNGMLKTGMNIRKLARREGLSGVLLCGTYRIRLWRLSGQYGIFNIVSPQIGSSCRQWRVTFTWVSVELKQSKYTILISRWKCGTSECTWKGEHHLYFF